MNTPKITNQGVAVFCIFCCVITVFGAFWLSRADHDLKLMSLQAVLTTGGTLLGIAGTLLVGIDAYRKLTGSDLPPGSNARSTELKGGNILPAPQPPPPPTPPAPLRNVIPSPVPPTPPAPPNKTNP